MPKGKYYAREREREHKKVYIIIELFGLIVIEEDLGIF